MRMFHDELSNNRPFRFSKKAFNEFVIHELAPAVIVKGKFFIGGNKHQLAVPVVSIKTMTSGDEIFLLTDTWTQNQNVDGSLMIRLIFGHSDVSVPTGLAVNKMLHSTLINHRSVILYIGKAQKYFYYQYARCRATVSSKRWGICTKVKDALPRQDCT